MSDTNRAVQSLNMARDLKFRIQKVEGLYYPCEIKGADQLRGCREADLRLCFRMFSHDAFEMSCCMTKPANWALPLGKTQISLGIRLCQLKWLTVELSNLVLIVLLRIINGVHFTFINR